MGGLRDRDYTETFSIEMEWREWNRIFTLARCGMRVKRDNDWPEEELEKDREIVEEFNFRISDNNPGNGMDDWPESMREAYNKAIGESIREEME